MATGLKQVSADAVNNQSELRDWPWRAAGAAIVAISAVLRFYDLALKPLHHDEGVNGFFLTTLYRTGVYKYDPANYHGPTLYYIALAFAKVFGLETVPIRASVAIFGVLTVALVLYLRRYLGLVGSLAAALFVAVSPGMSFISRYFIHETFFVFLSLAIVVSIILFIERERAGRMAIIWFALILLVCFLPTTLNLADYLAGENTTALWAFRAGFAILELALAGLIVYYLLEWDGGRPVYLLLAAACASLYFATKETAFITLGTMAIAVFCIWLWLRIYGCAVNADGSEPNDTFVGWTNFRGAFHTRGDALLIAAACSALFIYLFVLFFSSFFTYPDGVRGAIDAYALWTKTGSKDHTQNGNWAYFSWGIQSEAPIFVLSAVGTLIAFAKARHRFAMFAGLWTVGLLAAYSLIPYKTPWLALSFILPMCLSAGYAINEIAAAGRSAARGAAGILLLAAAIWLGYQAYLLNFVSYDDEDQAYVYAHTKRQFLDLIEQIKFFADASGKGRDAKIDIVSPDYWPMVWYLKDYNQANFHGRLIDTSDAEIIVAKKGEQDAEVIRRFSPRYRFVDVYALRPGVDLVLLVRKDLAPNEKELYRLTDER